MIGRPVKFEIQIVIHGWGGSTLSNGQVQVEDDMARKWYLLLKAQYLNVHLHINLKLHICNSKLENHI